MLGPILLVILVILLIGSYPRFGINQYGYGPFGGLGVVLIIIIILYLFGVI